MTLTLAVLWADNNCSVLGILRPRTRPLRELADGQVVGEPRRTDVTTVQVELPDETLRDLAELAKRKGISRTEALLQSVAETKRISDMAPHGARIEPVELAGRIRGK